jgi:predicted metalloenzyme YecM
MVLLENCVELTDLLQQLDGFERKIYALADKIGLSLANLECDHISLRCHQTDTADRWRRGLMRSGTLLSENEINGRPICLFELEQPIKLFGKLIDCIELPYPGNKFYPLEGWEHIELVLPGSEASLHQRALALLSDAGLAATGIKIKCSNPKGEGERLANPTLAVTDGEVTIKFHPYSIRAVIASERR